jgi:hypothetical protein
MTLNKYTIISAALVLVGLIALLSVGGILFGLPILLAGVALAGFGLLKRKDVRH